MHGGRKPAEAQPALLAAAAAAAVGAVGVVLLEVVVVAAVAALMLLLPSCLPQLFSVAPLAPVSPSRVLDPSRHVGAGEPSEPYWEPYTFLLIAPSADAPQGGANPFVVLVLLLVLASAGWAAVQWVRTDRIRSRRKLQAAFEIEQDESGGASYSSGYSAL